MTRKVVIDFFGGCYLGLVIVSVYTKNKIKIITKVNTNLERYIMCGIVGLVGKNKNKKIIKNLIDSLKKLEYRGYDSAGIAYLDKGISVIKEKGEISSLEKNINFDKETNMGIGHTRWATHGGANKVNSHPHLQGKITIVHNGIIENYQALKDKLSKQGYTFKSETDTEIAAALIDLLYKKNNDMIKTLDEFKTKAKGSYAIAIICEDFNDRIFIIKNASPLIIGIGENENLIASDVPAILDKTDKYVLLEDGEYGFITYNDIQIFNNLKKKKINVLKFDGDKMSIDKNGYDHFMLKEIHEQPEIVKNIIDKFLKGEFKLPKLDNYEKIVIVGCGSAYHAGLVGKYLIEKNLNIEVDVQIASEFRYKKLFIDNKTLVIAISQSGETADTLAAVKISKAYKAHTLGIVNVKESSIAREVDEVVYTLAGTEIAVATTKGYLSQILIFTLMCINGETKKVSELKKLPIQMEKIINMSEKYKKIANCIKDKNDVFFIGRLIDYGIALEGSLKLKEISYIHSEAYAAGELKHGTISLIEENTPVFALVSDKGIAEKTISNVKEVKARGADVILIITDKCNLISDCYDYKLVMPSSVEEATPILMILPLQLIAYEVAKLRDCSIDKPKNLAKSVTVE